MRTLITIILFSLAFNIYSQETEIINKVRSELREQYSVLKQANKIKHGTYVKYFPLIGERVLVFELGNYINGKKHGQWEKFYEKLPKPTWNTTKEIGNYFEDKKNGIWFSYYIDTTSSIINAKNLSSLFQTNTVINDSTKNKKLKQAGMYLNDKKVGPWVTLDYNGILLQKYDFSKAKLLFEKSITDSSKYNTNRKPLFFGGQSLLEELLLGNIESESIEISNMVKKDSTYAIITFTINENGSVSNVSIDTNLNLKIFKDELIRLIMLTDGNWLPAIENDKIVISTYKIGYDHLILSDKYSKSIRELHSLHRFRILD